jgi:hypothetical protein
MTRRGLVFESSQPFPSGRQEGRSLGYDDLAIPMIFNYDRATHFVEECLSLLRQLRQKGGSPDAQAVRNC